MQRFWICSSKAFKKTALERKSLSLSSYLVPSAFSSLPKFQFSTNQGPQDKKSGEKTSKYIATNQEFKEIVDEVDLESEEAKDAFQTKEQIISIKLLKTKTSEEVLNLYEEEIKTQKSLSSEELCLLVYFACYFKGNIIEDPRFVSLMDHLFSKITEVSSIYLFTLLHSLGIFCFDFGYTIPIDYQKLLGGVILKNKAFFELNQVSAACWSVSQAINAPENKDLRDQIVSELTKILLNHEEILTGLDYANILSAYTFCSVGVTPELVKLVKLLERNVNKLETEDLGVISRLIMSLGELNLPTENALKIIFQDILNGQIQNLQPEDAAGIILAYADKIPQEIGIFKELVKNIHANIETISISAYQNIWLAIAKYRVIPQDIEKTLNVLKNGFFKNKVWSGKDFEPFEIINIIISMSSIKMNDKEFLGALIKYLEQKLDKLDNTDLVNFARAMLIYIKQFEDLYLKIHEECSKRANYLSEIDKKVLKETFTKAKARLPRSPFIDPSLY